MKKAWVLTYPLRAQQRLWSDWADAQADLSLRWAYMPFCWFCHEAAHRWHTGLQIWITVCKLCFICPMLCCVKFSFTCGDLLQIDCVSTTASEDYMATSTKHGSVVIWNLKRKMKVRQKKICFVSGNSTDLTFLGPTLKKFGTSDNFSSFFRVFWMIFMVKCFQKKKKFGLPAVSKKYWDVSGNETFICFGLSKISVSDHIFV